MLCYEVCIVHMSTTFTLPKYREKCIITRKKNNKTNLIYIHTIGRLKIVIQNSQYKPIPDKIPREKNVIWHMRMSPKTPLNLYIYTVCGKWKVIICNMHTHEDTLCITLLLCTVKHFQKKCTRYLLLSLYYTYRFYAHLSLLTCVQYYSI